MRPHKRILIVGNDEARAGVLAFLLHTHSYDVDRAFSPAEAIGFLASPSYSLLIFDLPFGGDPVVFDLPFEGVLAVTEAARSLDYPPQATVGLVKSLSEVPVELCFDAVLTRSISASELLERIKVMTARKRGPKLRRKPPVAAAPVTLAREVSA